MEAPDIGPPTMVSSPTVAPMAKAAACPTALTSVATAMMTSMRKKVNMISMPRACPALPAGTVAPISAMRPSSAQSVRLAAAAPASWALQ